MSGHDNHSGNDDNHSGNDDNHSGNNDNHSDSSGNHYFSDPSNNDQYDMSNNPIVNYTLNQVTTPVPGVTVINQQGTNAQGSEVTNSVMLTTDPTDDIQVTEKLTGVIETYNDETNPNTNSLLNQIKGYAAQIQCSEFQGKGTIEDYTGLFQAAAQIANETKQMQLDVDVEGFTEFGQAADDLSALFTSFIIKLENVSIIDDTAFLTSICSALQKICNLSAIFGKFKQTILATSKIELPKSAHDTRVVLESVMDEINCAMGYINYFVSGPVAGQEPLEDAELDQEDKAVISTAISTIEHWNTLCEEGVSIAMTNNADIQYINNANTSLQSSTITLKNATASLKAKLAAFNINP